MDIHPEHPQERHVDETAQRSSFLLIVSLCLFLAISHIRGQIPFPLQGFFIGLGILILTFSALVLRWRDFELSSRRFRFILFAFFLFFIWAALRTFTAPVPSEAYALLGSYIEGLWIFIFVLLVFPLNRKNPHIVIAYIIAIMALSIFKALKQYLWEFSEQLEEFPEIADMFPEAISRGIAHALAEKRVLSFYGNPNIFCGFLAMGFPLLLGLAIRKKVVPALRILLLILCVLLVITALLTGSRGGMAALLFGAFLYGYLSKRSRHVPRWFFFAALLCIVIILLAIGLVLYRANTQRNTRAGTILARYTNIETIRERVYYQEVVIKMLEESPLLGKGLGSYALMYPKLKNPAAREARYSHNVITHIGAELGLVGVILIGIFFYLLYKYALSVSGHIPPELRVFHTGLLAGISAFLFSSLIDYTFFYREFFLDFMLLSTTLVVLSAPNRKEQLPHANTSDKMCIIIVLLVGSILSVKVFFQHQLAEYEYQRGLDLIREKRLESALGRLERAVRYEPESPQFQATFGKTLFLTGQVTSGLSVLERAALLNPYSAQIQTEIADSYEEMGYLDKALEYRKEALSLYPAKALYHYKNALTYMKLGMLDEAIKEAEQATEMSENRFEKKRHNELLETLQNIKERSSQ